MSDVLADYEPRLELVGGDDTPLARELVAGEQAAFSFRCPNCNKFRIEVVLTPEGLPVDGEIRWRTAGVMPALSVHPSIWSKHGWYDDVDEYHKCEWHRVIFKGRFIDEVFAWPVEDPANAKFG